MQMHEIFVDSKPKFYSQVSNKRVGLNKQVAWNFSSNLNKRGGKIGPQITVNFFLKTISEHAHLIGT